MRLLGNRLLVFDYKDLEILQSLHDGKSIVAQFHQPRPDLFVLINSNPVYCNDEIIEQSFQKQMLQIKSL